MTDNINFNNPYPTYIAYQIRAKHPKIYQLATGIGGQQLGEMVLANQLSLNPSQSRIIAEIWNKNTFVLDVLEMEMPGGEPLIIPVGHLVNFFLEHHALRLHKLSTPGSFTSVSKEYRGIGDMMSRDFAVKKWIDNRHLYDYLDELYSRLRSDRYENHRKNTLSADVIDLMRKQTFTTGKLTLV